MLSLRGAAAEHACGRAGAGPTPSRKCAAKDSHRRRCAPPAARRPARRARPSARRAAAALLDLGQPVVQRLDQLRAALRVVEQVVLQVRVALHHPDVAQHLVQHARRAAGAALLAQLVQHLPGARAEQPDHDLAVGERGVVVGNLAQRGRRRRAAAAWPGSRERMRHGQRCVHRVHRRSLPHRSCRHVGRRAMPVDGGLSPLPADAIRDEKHRAVIANDGALPRALSHRSDGDPMKLQIPHPGGRGCRRAARAAGAGPDRNPVVALDGRRPRRMGQRPGQGLQRQPEGLQGHADLQGQLRRVDDRRRSPPSAPATRRTSCRCSKSAPPP